MVAEADESDRSFLKLSPAIAVMTNIDREHMEATAASPTCSRRSSTSPTRCRSTARSSRAPTTRSWPRCCRGSRAASSPTASTRADAEHRGAATCVLEGFGARCDVVRVGGRRRRRRDVLGELTLRVPGRHIGAERAGGGRRRPRARRAVRPASPRRSPISGAPSGASSSAASSTAITVVDDYGHHPTEIAAVLAAARAGAPGARRGRVPAASLHAHARSDREFGLALAQRGRGACSPTSMRRARTRFPA